jgi:hypothetical protein
MRKGIWKVSRGSRAGPRSMAARGVHGSEGVLSDQTVAEPTSGRALRAAEP